MPLLGPDHDDKTKLHMEINQIANQRFQITTAAITITGGAIAWMLPKEAPASGSFEFVLSTILSLLLFALFYWSHVLLGVMRFYTTYLVQKQASNWERDALRFRDRRYFGYTKIQSTLFIILNAIAYLFPFVIQFASLKGATEPTIPLYPAQFFVFVVTELFMLLMGFAKLFDHEHWAQKQWKRLDESPES